MSVFPAFLRSIFSPLKSLSSIISVVSFCERSQLIQVLFEGKQLVWHLTITGVWLFTYSDHHQDEEALETSTANCDLRCPVISGLEQCCIYKPYFACYFMPLLWVMPFPEGDCRIRSIYKPGCSFNRSKVELNSISFGKKGNSIWRRTTWYIVTAGVWKGTMLKSLNCSAFTRHTLQGVASG